ncbi:unnamed protein product [Bursaphelenchus xylophilus]|uniref:(pine wood nematode) hypothetical protein n=1 Tax=Bursaphelenchus xylophilus TaxID=6326 RepID=A0A1I7RQP3_BURXY|nr:unnamed protein product [Bursaphelenchus xylophilus]CAG9104911.1 unnamed protein product [Bursaphelenchus xylophilus]
MISTESSRNLRKRRRRYLKSFEFGGDGCSRITLVVVMDIRAFRELERLLEHEYWKKVAAEERMLESLGLLQYKPCRLIIFEKSGDFDVVDLKGNGLVLSEFYESLRLESGMWFLSTLGGGFSSLGDCGDKESALKALRISETQFKVALRMGDDFMCGRAVLYYGTAMTQLGDYQNAFRAVLRVFIHSLRANDEALFRMSAALYMKISYTADEKFRSNKKFRNLKRLYKMLPGKNGNSLRPIDLQTGF